LQVLKIGGGQVATLETDRYRMILPPKRKGYADAQLDDYHALPRRKFPWQPPLRVRLRARASHPAPLGTLGFGFWNDPFTLSLGQGGAARRLPAAPNALWFFYGSPPNDMALDPAVPGHGWKAASLRSPPVPSPLLAFPALAAVALAQVKWLRRSVMQTALGFVRAEERLLMAHLRTALANRAGDVFRGRRAGPHGRESTHRAAWIRHLDRQSIRRRLSPRGFPLRHASHSGGTMAGDRKPVHRARLDSMDYRHGD
jgi:hypothetical protein